MQCLFYPQSDPAHRQNTSKVAMRENGDIALQIPESGNDPIRAQGNLGW